MVLLALALLACNASGWRLQGQQEDLSVNSAISSLATLLLNYNPAVAPSHLSGDKVARVAPKATIPPNLAVSSRVGHISAVDIELIAAPALAAVIPAVIAFKKQRELDDARLEAEEAASAAKSDLDRMEEETSALAKHMNEQRENFQSRISNLKAEHLSELEDLQKQVSQAEKAKSKESELLSDKTIQAQRLQMQLTAAKEENSALAVESESTLSNLQEEKSALAKEMESVISNMQEQLDEKDVLIATTEANIESLEYSISSLQMKFDEKTEEAQILQAKFEPLQKGNLALAKDLQAQLDATEQMRAEKTELMPILEKQTLEAKALQKKLDNIEQEKSALTEDVVAVKQALADKLWVIAALQNEKAVLLKQKADLQKDKYEQEPIVRDLGPLKLEQVKGSKDGSYQDVKAQSGHQRARRARSRR